MTIQITDIELKELLEETARTAAEEAIQRLLKRKVTDEENMIG